MSDLIKVLGCLLLILPFSVSVSVGEYVRRVSANNETIVSPGNVFELGLFRYEHLPNWYLGIWYKNDPEQTRVWVANRDKPFPLSTGTLMFSDDNVFLFSQNNRSVWSTNLTGVNLRSHLVAELLDNGNFVVKDSNNDDPNGFLWQSFDAPTDTLLPHMKLGRDPKTGKNIILTSWNPYDDPSSSTDDYFSLQLQNRAGLFELSIWRQHDLECMYRSEPWDGNQFGDIPLEFLPNFVISNWTMEDEDSNITFLMLGQNNSRLTLDRQSLDLFTWNPKTMEWNFLWSSLLDDCSKYQLCGPNGLCSLNTNPLCSCIDGFEPLFRKDLGEGYWRGCRRKTLFTCTGDLFIHLKNVKLPDTKSVTVDRAVGKEECEKRCRENCECTAYAHVDILNGQPGCVIWFGELIDIRNYTVGGRDLYVKVALNPSGSCKL